MIYTRVPQILYSGAIQKICDILRANTYDSANPALCKLFTWYIRISATHTCYNVHTAAYVWLVDNYLLHRLNNTKYY